MSSTSSGGGSGCAPNRRSQNSVIPSIDTMGREPTARVPAPVPHRAVPLAGRPGHPALTTRWAGNTLDTSKVFLTATPAAAATVPGIDVSRSGRGTPAWYAKRVP
ncbi:hypothetical protein GCM10011608_54810 [Micromonospora sonchi]|uniref:Uncharacterized protein n=1 Tax=Micromonospora sonchi TaxID=1763543 RepID=A0A917U6N1_9ACTN|nr:hypothetical protein GCM10011608_54810 [Micromonospora sonchi]